MESPEPLINQALTELTFVRKARRKADLESKAENPEDRAKDLFNNLFKGSRPYSVYRYQSPVDLLRIALAMNANRLGNQLTEQSSFLGFREEDVQSNSIEIRPTTGGTPCPLVNSRHCDLDGEEEKFLQLLLRGMKTNTLQILHCSKPELKAFTESARSARCRAVERESTGCLVEGCE